MAEKLNDVVKNLLDGMHAISKTDTIVGEPVQVGGATVIPVHRLRVGFLASAVGAGGQTATSEGKTGGRAVGGTAQIEPVAVLAVGPDGKPRLLSVEGDAQVTWQALLRDAPELFSKLTRKLAERVISRAMSPTAKAEGEPAELVEKK